MAVPTQQRRLAAIMAADVVGFTRLMSEDETGTLTKLKKHRAELVDPTIAEYHGRIVKLMGDGALVEFASVVDAVRCAVEIQRAMSDRNASVERGHAIEFRIGINLGDIIIEGDDIYGEGVNVAARLEALARPGGVCVSDLAHQMARAGIDVTFEDLGEQEVKNIAAPIRVWHWGAGTSGIETGSASVVAAARVKDRPSIAVLPFDNMSHDPEQEYFSDGLTEDLITDLSQISDVFVSSRHAVCQYKGRPAPPQQVAKDLGVRYILEGSARRAGKRIRINAQLIDGASGFHLWAQRYDRDFEDIFELQDEITNTIVEALRVHLTPKERASIERRYTDNLEAYDLFLRGREYQLRRTEEGLARAGEALERAVALDPQFAAAHALLSDNYRQEWTFGWRDDPDVLDRSLELAREAVRLDDRLPLAHTLLGWIHLWRKEHGLAIAEVEHALALDPSHAEGWARLGHILVFSGRAEEGLSLIEKAMRLDPHYPFLYPFFLGHALQSLERYDEAIAAYTRAITLNPDHLAPHHYLAAACVQAGRMEDARAEAAETLRLCPHFSARRVGGRIPEKRPGVSKCFVENMLKAGLPE